MVGFLGFVVAVSIVSLLAVEGLCSIVLRFVGYRYLRPARPKPKGSEGTAMPKIQCQCGAPFSAIQKVPDDGHLHLQCFCEKCARYFVVCMGSIPTPETCDELLSIFNAAPITVELVESDCKKN